MESSEWVAVGLTFGVLVPAAALGYWAFWRYLVLTKRLHPMTPEQRRRTRQASAVVIVFVAASFGVVVAIGSGGTTRLVALAVIVAILLLDAVLTPVLHYRRARREAHDVPRK